MKNRVVNYPPFFDLQLLEKSRNPTLRDSSKLCFKSTLQLSLSLTTTSAIINPQFKLSRERERCHTVYQTCPSPTPSHQDFPILFALPSPAESVPRLRPRPPPPMAGKILIICRGRILSSSSYSSPRKEQPLLPQLVCFVFLFSRVDALPNEILSI